MDKDTRTAILFFGIELACIILMYFVGRISNNLAAQLLILTIGFTAIGVYIVNLIFIGRLLAESRVGVRINTSALRIGLATALYPVIALVIYNMSR